MTNALHVFQELMNQTQLSDGLYTYLDEKRVPIDATDLLRWEWVLAVSALDKYIHDIVRIGMMHQFLGQRSVTEKYNSFRIDMRKYVALSASPTPQMVFESEIIRQHNYLAFQSPDKISDALSYIWTEQHKWDVISSRMATPISSRDLKTKLNNIVVRRNQIVHEGDCFSSNLPLQKQQINKSDVSDVICFITELVNAIHVNII